MDPRVAFVVGRPGESWMGGVNYYANLLHALAERPDRRISTLLFAPPGVHPDWLARFPADHIVLTSAFEPRAPLRLAGKASERLLGRNLAIEALLKRHRVDVLSHMPPLGPRSPVRTIGWIPDFQHVHLPGFFGADEITRRAAGDRALAEHSTRVVLSSEHARADFARLFPDAASRARTLNFVAGLAQDEARSPEQVRVAYSLPERWLHLPNQLWAHKNHRVALDALAIVRGRGLDATIVATGPTEDYRRPGFRAEFEEAIRAAGLADRFRQTGAIPFADVAALMRGAVAVINPSLFEGWSTTVEEAKSLGKRVLLSDIPVHREQAPERGRYFAPDDAEALADLIAEAFLAHDPAAEARAVQAAAAALPGRVRRFAETYQAIALEAAR